MFERTQLLAILAGAAGGAIAIASMEVFSVTTAFPLVAIPFATSIVTVLGSPKAAPAQPRALVGGHLISTVVGLLIAQAVRTGTVGCGAGGWCGDDCNAPDRHISPAGRNRSVWSSSATMAACARSVRQPNRTDRAARAIAARAGRYSLRSGS